MGRLFLALSLVMLAACGGHKTDEPAPVSQGARAYVEVHNGYALPVDIYAGTSGSIHRLGTVHPGMDGHFRMPPVLVNGGAVQFRAQPGGVSDMYRSGEILVAPGSIVDFNVDAVLFNSTVRIRP